MIELLTIPDKEYQQLNTKLEEYKAERKELEEAYRARSKDLTKEIHAIEDRIKRDKRIRERRGPEYMQYRNEKIIEMHENGTSHEDLAKEFNIAVSTVKHVIERYYTHRHIRMFKTHLKQTDGIVNDSLSINALLWHKARQAQALKNMNVVTVGDYYKMKTQGKISDSIQECVEHEIEMAPKRHAVDKKWEQKRERYNFYYGQ
jgi:transposase